MENIFATHATGLDCDLSLKEYFAKHGSEIARTRKWKPVDDSGTYKTLEVYTGYLEDLSRHLPDKSISTLTFFDLQRGLEKVQTDNRSGKRYADSTMKSFRSMLNDIYGYAQNRNDAYNIINYFSTRLSKDKSNITPIQSILDPTLSAEEILARTRRALEGRRYLPRSLNLTQQAHLTRCLVENVNADGRYCGLGIILYGGLRSAEARKILWGDLVPFLDHPDRLMMYLYETRNASGQVEDHMKTPNAYRKVPVHMELHRFLFRPDKHLAAFLLAHITGLGGRVLWQSIESHGMIEHGAELIVDCLEIHRRIGHSVFVRCFHDDVLPMEHVHRFHITHTLVFEIRQNLFLDNTALCHPSVLPDAVL